ncbi:MAG: hypothetical protein RLZZ502_745 [Pseudomonadota bacterium]
MHKKTAWLRREERGSEFWMRFIVRFALLCGRAPARFLLYFITWFFYLRAHEARQASRQFLGMVLGRPPSLRERYRHFFYFASCLLDRVFFLNGRIDLFDVRYHGLEHLVDWRLSGKGGVVMSAHVGSFDAMRAVGHHGPDISMGEVDIVLAMYAANASKIMRFLNAINPALKAEIVALGQVDSMLKLSERAQNGGLIGMLADRTLDNVDSAQLRSSVFLGKEAQFAIGPFLIAAMLRVPTYFMLACYEGANRYRIEVIPLLDFSQVDRTQRQAAIEEAHQRYVSLLAKQVAASPFNWFNFYDFWT